MRCDARRQIAHSSSRTPYDNKSLVRPCHPVVEESVRHLQAEHKILDSTTVRRRAITCKFSVQVSSALAQGYLYAAATPNMGFEP